MKKDRLAIDTIRLSLKMLPKFYQTHLRSVLNTNQYILLNLLVELLQGQKQVRIERLAANLPLPILFESRRRYLQRFLVCPKLTISHIWFAIIKFLLESYFSKSKELLIVIDRTQWRKLNLLMVSLVWNSRAIPLTGNLYRIEAIVALLSKKLHSPVYYRYFWTIKLLFWATESFARLNWDNGWKVKGYQYAYA